MSNFRFSRPMVGIVFAGALLLGTSAVAQETTEQFIPIGKSPGVSGKYSYIGRIVAMDESTHEMTVEDSKGRHSITVNSNTLIWLDRNQSKKKNMTASYADCEVGRRVEVMHTRDDKTVAKWIKIAE